MKKATLKDVAELAGVSTAAVSYYINGSKKISDKSRKKIQDAIEELSYHPNQLARNFKNGRRNTIGFIVPDIANIYFSSIIEEIENSLASKGINLIIANTKETPEKEKSQIQTLSNGLVDGLIIASTLSDFKDILPLLPEGFPVIMIDRGIEDCRADQVLISSETAMYQGVSELVSKGNTQIGYIAGLKHIYTTRQRIEEFQEAVYRTGLPEENTRIVYSDPDTPSVNALAGKLLQSGCTAIVAGNNIITMDLVNLSLRQSFSEGKDFHILGYSYGDWYTWLPFLNSIDVPTRDLGRLAIRRLLERMADPSVPVKDFVLTCSYRSGII